MEGDPRSVVSGDPNFAMPRSYRVVRGLCCLLAGLYALLAAWAVLWLSPRVPYADTWRFDAQLLSHPFPHSIFEVDNGHAQLPSRLLRWLELTFWHGNQWPTIVAGLLLLAVCVWLWVSLPWHDTQRILPQRTLPQHGLVAGAWLLAGVTGLCWLGSSRTLAHGNEAIHSYLVIACLFGAVRLVSRPGRWRLAWALSLAALATFTFGTGAAVFAAIMITLLLRKARWGSVLATVVAAALAGVCYLCLPAATHASGAASGIMGIGLDPARQIPQLARWLAAPWLLAGGPLVDAGLLDQLPGALRALAAPLARLSTGLFGPAETAVWPELGFGLLGVAWLVWLSWLARFRPVRQPRAEWLALATAWFVLVCAVLVVVARSDYFLQYPRQIYAPRYAVWYTLFWCGLLGATIWRLHAGGRTVVAVFLAFAVALVLLPSSAWMGMRAAHMSRIAARDALGVRFGIIDRHANHGENQVGEMARARPLLRQARVSIFAPAAGPLPGASLDRQIRVTRIVKPTWRPVDNVLPTPAARVRFTLADPRASRLLLLDGARHVIGAARRGKGRDQWQGRVRGRPASLYSAEEP